MAGPFIIYGLIDPRTREVRYIGKSARGLSRPMCHVAPLVVQRDETHKGNWVRQLIGLGIRPSICVLEEVAAVEALDEAERRWIAGARAACWPLTNLTDGGDGVPGRAFTAEQLAKARARVFTPEWRSRISAAKKGKPKSPEHREKLRQASLRMSEETKRKIGERGRGRLQSEATRLKRSEKMKAHPGLTEHLRKLHEALAIPVLETTTGRRFPSAGEAERSLGLGSGSVSRILSGRRPSAKGFHFRRA